MAKLSCRSMYRLRGKLHKFPPHQVPPNTNNKFGLCRT